MKLVLEYFGLTLLVLLALSGGAFLLRLIAAALRAPDFVHRRGALLTTQAEAARWAKSLRAAEPVAPPSFHGLAFGGIHLPLQAAFTHFMIQGSTGSGKTSCLLLLLHSILTLIARGTGCRLVLFDPKRDFPRWLHSVLPPDVPLWLFNPLDSRCSSWKLAADIRTAAEAAQLADILLPTDKRDNNPYFRDTARQLLSGVTQVLQMFAGDRWALRDLILLTRTRKRLAAVLRCCPATHDLVAQHLATAKTAKEVISTIGSALGDYAVVAACWDRADRAVSLRDFLDREAVLVLGYDDGISAALEPLNRLALRILSDLILARNDPRRPTFFGLDEFRLLGKADLLPLALKGRSAGASLAISFQDINGLEHVLTEKVARELCGNLMTKGFLRVDSEAAARLAADSLGEQEGWQWTFAATQSPQGASTSRSEQVVRRPLILPDEVRCLPLPSWEEGVVSGYFKSPFTGSYFGQVHFRDQLSRVELSATFPDYVPRPAEHQRLRPLTVQDIHRLGLPCSPQLLSTIRGDEQGVP